MRERAVTVIGGGLAGIAAALELADAGAPVTLLEVRPRLGGAAYSFQRDGLWLDNGQHVFLRCCTEYRKLLPRLGTEADTVLQPRLSIPVVAPGGRVAWLRRSALPAPLHLAGSLLRYRHLNTRERLGAAAAARALAKVSPRDAEADRQSFGAWLRRRHQSPAAIEGLWELIGRPTLNLDSDDSSLAAAAFVFRAGLLEHADAGDLGYARVPLQRIHGDAALRALSDAGVEVRLGLRVQRLETMRDGGLLVSGQGERFLSSAVVLAVPNDRAPGLLPEGAVRDVGAIERLGSSPIVNLHLVYDRRVLAREFVAAVNSPLQFVFDRTASSGLQRGQCLAVSLSAAEAEIDTPAQELEARFSDAVAQLLPAARQATVERFVVTRERFATFRAAPGAWCSRPGPQTAVDGLALAGAWTDTGWPATMESAVRSGRIAAAAVADILRDRQPSHPTAAEYAHAV
ncbi:MAG: FAD-dependent oxidoreductase [Solirubrobacterales bacterium]|nr:FAD-dependent oxidoreductase [Solirubrobacterales bacterium]